ncbi:MAG: hypothetical protein ACXVCP_05615 [Bdellovibrio sp.]
MKKTLTCMLILLASHSHALVMQGKLDCGDSFDGAAQCTVATTSSLPTLIVQDSAGNDVWNASDDQLLAQYQSELDGLSPIFYIKRYADVRNEGDIEAAKTEIKNNLLLLNKQK